MPANAPNDPADRALARRLKGLNIYLVGMMGAGKSAVGRPLARRLGYRFIDADTTLEQAAGSTIPQVFAEQGEGGFRELETAVLGRIATWHSLVVATGGGVVAQPVNWGLMHQGVVVWLDAPEGVLLQRLQADPTPRPLLQVADPEARLRKLLEQRRPLYGQADLHIQQQDGDPGEVADQVIAALPSVLKERPKPPAQPAQLVDRGGEFRPSLN
ncbi:MAG: shikimate kinase [Prochlorococcaceae cyanobacterium]